MDQVLKGFQDKSVCVIGLGYVGLTLAVAMADVGFTVLGVEIRDEVIDSLKQGKPHFHEPGLEEKIKLLSKKNRLTYSKYIPQEWQGSVFIITVGTPLADNRQSRMDMIANVAKEVSERLKPNDMVIMRSTVKLGTTVDVVMPILQQKGVPFDLAFCPERTLEGKALQEIRSLPQIVGGINLSAAVRASQIFQYLTPTVIRVTSVETAEVIKLIDNSQRDVNFAFSNEVARICDVVGVSAKEVISAGKLGYPRTNLPMPGPVGGPCLEKDPYILAEGLNKFGLEPEITLMARQVNERQPKETISDIASYLSQLNSFPTDPKIAFLGIAFKGIPATDDLRGTMAKPITQAVKEKFPTASYHGYDAVVSSEQISAFGLQPEHSLEAICHDANLIVIMNNHPVFASMPIESLAMNMGSPCLIYDYWNHFNAQDLSLPESVCYTGLGCFHNSLRFKKHEC